MLTINLVAQIMLYSLCITFAILGILLVSKFSVIKDKHELIINRILNVIIILESIFICICGIGIIYLLTMH